MAVPAALTTRTEYFPAFGTCTFAIVSELLVAFGMSSALKRH
jgi:hypothetical protein